MTKVPAGTVTPLENVNGRNATRFSRTGEQEIMHQYPRFGQGVQRTVVSTIETLGLPQKAVDLVHLVNPGLRPAFLCYSSFDFMAERFKVFWVGKEMV